ncbi:MAG: hypothetical protein EOP47_09725 [Sphingobacteriaceae bacterium]|nr:MAG: hypothetical protein EOP47_09725 [Sphingobacteriaceae bacterium]
MKTPALYKAARLTKHAKQKINNLFKQPQITMRDIEDLTPPERDYLDQNLAQLSEQLRGTQYDNFLAQVDQIIAPETKSDIWENNHRDISEVISENMRIHGAMPTHTEIASLTGLSRQTIAKHLKEYKKQPEFIKQKEQFTFMAPQLLANVYKFALDGDIRAARLYFEIIGAKTTPPQNTLHRSPTDLPGTQHNYIQINNTILSQENLARLTTDQLNQIEGIIKG